MAEEYKLGEIRRGNEPGIGFKSDALVIYIKCSDCDKTYFTQYDKKNNRPRTKTCRKCFRARIKNQFMSIKYTVSGEKEYRPYWRGYI